MKKNVFVLAILLLSMGLFQSVFAVRALKTPIKVKQPDGTELTIFLNGDEYKHFQTTKDGYLVRQDANGYYKYASINPNGEIVITDMQAKNPEKRLSSEKEFLKTITQPEQVNLSTLKEGSKMQRTNPAKSKTSVTGYPLSGSPKSLVILANFSDKSFSVSNPQAAFQAMLTQSGYSANGGTGSAKDYFMSSSYGKFSPDFVVVGPVTLPKTLAYYGANDSQGEDLHPDEMVAAACAAADAAGVDFTQYDTDNDGYVDNVFVYYAGYNEAEGGAANTIWPHRWSLTDAGYSGTKTFDGKIVNDYSCTSELKGTSGTNMCGIGTFCHEFGHVLGLPDFYDTSGTKSHTLDTWDIMDYGPYLNDGCTPPTYSAYERFFLGFLAPEEKNTPSNLTLQPIYQGTTTPASTSGQAYLLSATTHNLSGSSPNPAEFFMVEYRKHTGFDTYLGQTVNSDGSLGTVPADGMCIWHIDYSQTAWDSNNPNNYTGSGTTQTSSSHMRVYLQPLSGTSTTPGTTFTSGAFTPTTWAGTNINRAITEITKYTDYMTFKLMGGNTTDPALTSPSNNTTVDFGKVPYQGTDTAGVYIKGINLTGDLTLSLSGTNASEFSLPVATVSQADATSGYRVIVGFNAQTIGARTAVLTISGGGLSSSVSVNLTATATDGFLALPATNVAYNGFTANWTVSAGATGYKLDVYTLTGTASTPVTLLEEDFAGTSLSTGWTSDASGYYTLSELTSNVRLGSSKAYGKITSPALDLSKPAVITVKSKQFSSDTGAKIWVIAGTNDTITSFTNSTNYQTFTFNIPAKTSSTALSFFALKGKRVYLDYVKVATEGNSATPESLQGYPCSVGAVLSYDVAGLAANTDYYYTVTPEGNSTGISDVIAVHTLLSGIAEIQGQKVWWTKIATGIRLHNLPEGTKIILMDALGKKMVSVVRESNDVDFDLPSNGIYLLRLEKNQVYRNLKVIY